jgi:hypothetical protein
MQEFIALCSELIAFGNPFQTVAMAARRVPDKFFGGSISRLNGCGWGRVKKPHADHQRHAALCRATQKGGEFNCTSKTQMSANWQTYWQTLT